MTAMGSISRTTQEIHDSIGLAIRALQFEDIVRQLLEFNRSRLDGVDALMQTFLASLGDLRSLRAGDVNAFSDQLNERGIELVVVHEMQNAHLSQALRDLGIVWI